MFPMTLDELIAELVALRVDDDAGKLEVSCNAIEGVTDAYGSLDLVGAERQRWHWGDGITTENLKLRRVER